MAEPNQINVIEMTSEVVAAYVAKNHIQPGELPALIASVHASIRGLGKPPTPAEPPAKLTPPVPIKKTITDEYLVSLEDGKRYKTLRRHLTKLGLTPDQYRAKWGLPNDYPMMAPAYAAKRSGLAKSLGFGRRRVPLVAEMAQEAG